MPTDPNESRPSYVGIPPSELEESGLENYKGELEPETVYENPDTPVVEPLVERDQMTFEMGTDQRGEADSEDVRIIEDGYIPNNDGMNQPLEDEGDGQTDPDDAV
jgi:hypothetical protein